MKAIHNYNPDNPNCQVCDIVSSCIDYELKHTSEKKWIEDTIKKATKNHYCCNRAITVCEIPSEVTKYAKNNNINISNGVVRLSDNQIIHALKDVKKNLGNALTENELIDIAQNMQRAEIYFDTNKSNFVFVYDENGRKIKYVIQPEYRSKMNGEKEISNHFITGAKISRIDKYWEKIK